MSNVNESGKFSLVNHKVLRFMVSQLVNIYNFSFVILHLSGSLTLSLKLGFDPSLYKYRLQAVTFLLGKFRRKLIS